MMRLIELFLNSMAGWRARSGRSALKISSTSSVFAWRIRTAADNLLTIDENSMVRANIAFERPRAACAIGKRTFVGNGTISIAERVTIGDDVLISWGVTIADHHSHSIRFSERAADVLQWKARQKDWNGIEISPVRINDKVWIGFNSIILRGVSIGEGAVIGAGSVVTKAVEPWTVVAGSPARVIRELAENER
jgi:galactoside O-acetyltransferase